MGEIYKAATRASIATVAITPCPLFPPGADPDRRRRFRSEPRPPSGLTHPHIITIPTSLDGANYYMVMGSSRERTRANLIHPAPSASAKRSQYPCRSPTRWPRRTRRIVHLDLKPARHGHRVGPLEGFSTSPRLRLTRRLKCAYARNTPADGVAMR